MWYLSVCGLVYLYSFFFFFNDTATTEIYTLSLHDALPIWLRSLRGRYAFDLALDGDYYSQLALPFLGKFQVKNAVAAVAAAWRLAQDGFAIPRTAIVEGLRSATWPGRLEAVRERPLVLLDGAHNPAG